MKFRKDGKVYASFVDAVNEFFLGDRKIFVNGKKAELKFPDDVRQSMIWAYEDADMGRVRLNAKLMGYEVIEDTPTIAETAAKRKLTRADILHAAEKCVCGQREQDYGTPENNFKAIAELWEAYLNKACTWGVNVRVEAKDVAAMMALLKIARICTGKYKGDSWVDLAGYAACGGAWQSGNRPKEWEIEDEEDRRMEAKLEKVNAYCRLSGECDLCPVRKGSILFDLCHAKAFEAMDEEELDSYLTFFRNVAADRAPSCYSCKHMGCESDKEPCRDCKYLNKYEEDTGEQS